MALPAFIHLGLTGWPIAHSLSPLLHETGLAALGETGEYRVYPIPPLPDGRGQLKALLEQVRSGALQGINVTIPHKQAVIPMLDELTPVAAAVGAVNTVYCKDGRLVGDNTDVPGFMTDLRHFAAGWPKAHRVQVTTPGHALVLGAGGAARAVVYGLLLAGWKVTVASRRSEQAAALADDLHCTLGCDSPVTPVRLDNETLAGLESRLSIELVVNTTPVGMSPREEENPWPVGISLPKNAAVYDLVYYPYQTVLVREAHLAGLPATGGLGMLAEQAAFALERWLGRPAPRESMRQAVESTAGFYTLTQRRKA